MGGPDSDGTESTKTTDDMGCSEITLGFSHVNPNSFMNLIIVNHHVVLWNTQFQSPTNHLLGLSGNQVFIYNYVILYIPGTSRACIISCLIGKINLSNHSRNSQVCRDFKFSRFAHLWRCWTKDIQRSLTTIILISRPPWISKVKLRQSFSGSKVDT